jgi:curli production assembly/transport component CsgF
MIGSESQNKFKDKQVERMSYFTTFTQDLNAQLLNSVSRSLFTQQFGNDGISVGSYTGSFIH